MHLENVLSKIVTANKIVGCVKKIKKMPEFFPDAKRFFDSLE